MFIILCCSLDYKTAIAVAAPPKNLGDRGARCIYIPQQSRPFLKPCSGRYFYDRPDFIAFLDRSKCCCHVGRNCVSKFELEKKLWHLENHRKWLENGRWRRRRRWWFLPTFSSPDFFIFIFVVARWNLVYTFLAWFPRAKMKIFSKFELFSEKWPFFHILDLEYFRAVPPPTTAGTPTFYVVLFVVALWNSVYTFLAWSSRPNNKFFLKIPIIFWEMASFPHFGLRIF